MGLGLFAVAFVGAAVGLWLASQITEALRPVPQTPETLRRAPNNLIGYLKIGGCKLRYVRAGRRRRGRRVVAVRARRGVRAVGSGRAAWAKAAWRSVMKSAGNAPGAAGGSAVL